MDSYSSTSNTDSSSSSSTLFPYLSRQETKSGKPPPSFRSALHCVRKYPAKNAITKKPIAPLPPAPPKIYKVKPVEFKDVVQRLTGAAEVQSTRLRKVAPPPLSLSPAHSAMSFDTANNAAAENEEEKRWKSFETSFGVLSPVGFNLSPSSLAMLLSPGTFALFEPSASAVL